MVDVDSLASSIKSEFGGRVVHLVCSGLLLVVLTRVLGPSLYGLFALAYSTLMISRLFSEAGLPWSAASYISRLREEDPIAAADVLRESQRLIVATAGIVSLALILAADVIASLVGEPNLAPLLLIGSGLVFFYTLHVYYRHVLQGYGDIATSAKVHAVEGVLTVVVVGGLVLYRPTPTAAIVAYVLAYALAAIYGYVMVKGMKPVETAVSSDRRGVRGKLVRYSVPLLVTRLSELVDGQVDILLVGFFANPAAVAFYTLGKQISKSVQAPALSLGFALSPTYSSRKAAGKVAEATAVFEETLTKTLVLYVPACAGIFVIADAAVPAVFGDAYQDAVLIVQILSLYVLFQALVGIVDYAIDYLGRARSQAALKLVSSTSNLLLNLLLIPFFGAAGAAVATVITSGFYAFGSLYVLRTELPFDIWPVWICFARVGLVTVLMSAVVLASMSALSGIPAVAIGIAVGVGTWLVGCHLFDLLDVNRMYVAFRG